MADAEHAGLELAEVDVHRLEASRFAAR